MNNNRIWDPENKYSLGNVYSFKHWTFEISFRQHTLACFIFFLNRYAEEIHELTNEEWLQFKKLTKIVDTLYQNSFFKPDKINYLQLGNKVKHLHFHGIPRYERSINFNGKVWVDRSFGVAPLWTYEEADPNDIIEIKKLINIELFKNSGLQI
ncbi:MAG: hypothetical protein OHK0017_09280 [Patescibacteria group bacterium]